MQTKRKIQIALASLLLLLIPVAVIAQGTGGKKKKKERTEQVAPAKKPAKKPAKAKPVKTKPAKQEPPKREQPSTEPVRQEPPEPKPAPKPTTGTERGHEWVDLGLPSGVKWATCNVGAWSPEDYGDYFAWGETSTKSTYTEENCKTYERNMGDISGNPNYDAARANWGGSWRMPTKKECEELKTKCKWIWTTSGGKKGYKVVGPNGNSILLPAAGYRYGTSLINAGAVGYHWSSTPLGEDTQCACILYFDDGCQLVYWSYRNDGQSVRPVTE